MLARADDPAARDALGLAEAGAVQALALEDRAPRAVVTNHRVRGRGETVDPRRLDDAPILRKLFRDRVRREYRRAARVVDVEPSRGHDVDVARGVGVVA